MKAINRFYLMAIPVHCIPIEVCVNRVSLLWYPCVSRPPRCLFTGARKPNRFYFSYKSLSTYMYCLPYTFARRWGRTSRPGCQDWFMPTRLPSTGAAAE